MSHKRSLKRSINTLENTSGDYSPSLKSFHPKRSRTEDYSEQDESSAVRRSSRAPKPKVFDDEYTDTSVRSPGTEREVIKKKHEPKSVSRNQGQRRSIDDSLAFVDDEDASASTKRRSSRVPKPKLFNEDYVETAKIRGIDEKNEKSMSPATEIRVSHDWQKDTSFQKGSTKSKKADSGSKLGKLKSTPGQGKTNIQNDGRLELQSQPNIKGNEGLGAWESPKVRTSSRTPVPKKTFALIDDSPVSRPGEDMFEEGDLYVDVTTQEPRVLTQSKKVGLLGHSDSSSASGEMIDLFGTSPVSSKKKWPSKDTVSDEGKNKKSKKSKIGLDSSQVFKDVVAAEAPKKIKTNKKESKEGSLAKEKVKKTSSKAAKKTSDGKKSVENNKNNDSNDDMVDVISVQQVDVKKKLKKKKTEATQPGLQHITDVTKGMGSLGSLTGEHGKKSSKHSKPKHKDEPRSEVKDKDHHIILKVHLPHAEASHHSHHSHSHKKHKHKHSASESKSESGSDSKTKKPKLSLESEASALASEDKHKKKLSIKFKGLSSSTPGIEFQGDEKTVKKDKTNKDVESAVKKKKPKPSLDKPSEANTGSDEKQHVKVVIKKNKKDIKVITDEGEKAIKKVTKNKDIKEKAKEDKVHDKAEAPASIKTTPKKKSKAGESPKSADKEKRKIVSGYLLFCKKERSRIYEANPGLEFAQISQKVGESWKSLPESIKQEWKAKADNIKKNFAVPKEDKKTDAAKPGPDAVDMAAHLKLLGESLSVIGVSLMAQKETEVHGSLSVLLDSILCAICPLTFLTSHIPGIPGISKEQQTQILDDLAYTMPGLG